MKKSFKFFALMISPLMVIISTTFYVYSMPGFDINGDINECEQGDVCPQCMECVNTLGSYYCVINPDCELDDHKNFTIGNPNPPQNFLDIQRYDYNAEGGIEIGAGFAGWTFDFKFTPGTKVLGATIYYCNWGGEIACSRGVTGIFVTTSGMVYQSVPVK